MDKEDTLSGDLELLDFFNENVDEQELESEEQALTTQVEQLKKLLAEARHGGSEGPHAGERQRYNALQSALNDKDRQICQLEEFRYLYHRAQKKLTQLEESQKEQVSESEALLDQHDALRNIIADNKASISALHREIEELKALEPQLSSARQNETQALKAVQDLNAELVNANARQGELHDTISSLRRDREDLRRRGDLLDTELQKIKAQQADHEKRHQSSLEAKQRDTDALKQSIEQLEDQVRDKEELQKGLESRDKEITQLGENINALECAEESAKQREQALTGEIAAVESRSEDLERSLVQARAQLEEFAEDLEAAKQIISERDTELRTAQHHLAKKVKEATQLSEALEERDERIQGLEQLSADLQKREQELSDKLDVQLRTQRQREETLEAEVSQLRTAADDWQEKVDQLTRDLEAMKERCERVDELEAKQSQINTLLANLGNVVEVAESKTPPIIETAEPTPPVSPIQAPAALPNPTLSQGTPEPIQIETTESEDLFSMNAPTTPRMRQGLFDE